MCLLGEVLNSGTRCATKCPIIRHTNYYSYFQPRSRCERHLHDFWCAV